MDGLYGPGALVEFTAACNAAKNGATVTVGPTDSAGNVYVGVQWNDGSTMVICCLPTRVHFIALDARGAGIYDGLCEFLPPLFKGWGVVTFSASAGDLASKQVLLVGARSGFRETEPVTRDRPIAGLGLSWTL
jgi:hypothetical protein